MIKAAVEQAGSVDPSKLIAAVQSVHNLPTIWPGIAESFSAADHTGYPNTKYGICGFTLGPDDVEYLAPGF